MLPRRQQQEMPRRWTIWIVVALVQGTLVEPVAADPATAEQPNFVVILVDDLGWTDLGCYGSQYYETPHIDRLAQDGVRFTDGYAACAVCSPSRAALLTGNYPARIGITDWIRYRYRGQPPPGFDDPSDYESVGKPIETPRNRFYLEHRHVTLAEVLGEAGYQTCHIGKWHLGPDDYYPERQGFDINIAGCDYGMPPTYFFPWSDKNHERMPNLLGGKEGDFLTDRLAAEAVKFIDAHREQRFFLYFAPYAVHTPIQTKPALAAKYAAKPKAGQKNAAYAGMIQSVDEAVGAIRAQLAQAGLAENTVLIFTSDNGGYLPVTSNAPLRGGKGMMYEGGLRVPFIVYWPRVTEPGSTQDEPVLGIDVFPTLLDIAGVERDVDDRVDGVSLVPILADEEALDRAAIYWHFPHYRGTDADPYGVVRAGDYKLMRLYEDGSTQLYNLREDPSETTDLAEQEPEKAKDLDLMLSKWLISSEAKLVRPDPNYQPPAADESERAADE
ncbi:MAG: DUF4976 domain-containing protein [Planctomycetota bacterium]|nr:MAG: DUF4976 domain-containing protein [Planctomycetota bacterium]